MSYDILFVEVRLFPTELVKPPRDCCVLVAIRGNTQTFIAWYEDSKYLDVENKEIFPEYWAYLPKTNTCYYTPRRVTE